MITISNGFIKGESASPLLVGAFLDEDVRIAPEIDGEIAVLAAEKLLDFKTGKLNKVYTFGKLPHKVLYLVGLGKREDYSYEVLEESLSNVNYKLGKELVVDFESFLGDLNPKEAAKRFVKTVSFNNYVYDEMKTEKTDNELNLKFDTAHDIEKEIEEAFNLAVAVANTRDLVNKPYNRLSAEELAEYAESLAESLDDERVSCKIYGKKEIEALGMGAFLGVNKGSDAEPQVDSPEIRRRVRGSIGLVGKGINVRHRRLFYQTDDEQHENPDMAGAAAVLGTFEARFKNNLKINLQVVICATDNKDQRPGLASRRHPYGDEWKDNRNPLDGCGRKADLGGRCLFRSKGRLHDRRRRRDAYRRLRRRFGKRHHGALR